ncbi:hypothetical protein MHLP_02775 [Candidatus Mycoplasma haematolamae str. Purdue]|uniref:Uncharacterized protein n=1 Tax=Mycoplasma haematolamae (strain Purdue) TaxID=1212765 RepID=I7BA22_MYCHA|nr:hypothetical protein [Candidatus Mycoplasma haematolamae]AFO52135.1 hypothetical protein MHLP_02775 [Candidatus Mycoplasma haematolamae str. Purdue]
MVGVAKIAVVLGIGGGISSIVTPIVIVNKTPTASFKFTDKNGEKKTTILECSVKEGLTVYSKIDISKKTITCAYSDKPGILLEHWREIYGNGVGTLLCDSKNGQQDDKICHVKKFEVQQDGSLTFET